MIEAGTQGIPPIASVAAITSVAAIAGRAARTALPTISTDTSLKFGKVSLIVAIRIAIIEGSRPSGGPFRTRAPRPSHASGPTRAAFSSDSTPTRGTPDCLVAFHSRLKESNGSFILIYSTACGVAPVATVATVASIASIPSVKSHAVDYLEFGLALASVASIPSRHSVGSVTSMRTVSRHSRGGDQHLPATDIDAASLRIPSVSRRIGFMTVAAVSTVTAQLCPRRPILDRTQRGVPAASSSSGPCVIVLNRRAFDNDLRLVKIESTALRFASRSSFDSSGGGSESRSAGPSRGRVGFNFAV